MSCAIIPDQTFGDGNQGAFLNDDAATVKDCAGCDAIYNAETVDGDMAGIYGINLNAPALILAVDDRFIGGRIGSRPISGRIPASKDDGCVNIDGSGKTTVCVCFAIDAAGHPDFVARRGHSLRMADGLTGRSGQTTVICATLIIALIHGHVQHISGCSHRNGLNAQTQEQQGQGQCCQNQGKRDTNDAMYCGMVLGAG